MTTEFEGLADPGRLLIDIARRSKTLWTTTLIKVDPGPDGTRRSAADPADRPTRPFLPLDQPLGIATVALPVTVEVRGRWFPPTDRPDQALRLRHYANEHFDIAVRYGSGAPIPLTAARVPPRPAPQQAVAEIRSAPAGIEETIAAARVTYPDLAHWIGMVDTALVALEQVDPRPHLVVMPELAYPSFWPGAPEKGRDLYQRRPELRRLQLAFEARLQDSADRNGWILAAGTHHDWTTFDNVAVLYFPGMAHVVEQTKFTSAIAIGERVRTARSANLPLYEYRGFRFAVLICSDAMDIGITLKQFECLGSGQPTVKPDAILVPSFFDDAGSRSVSRACRQLSELTGTTVVFVNHGGAQEPSAAFMCGERLPARAVEAAGTEMSGQTDLYRVDPVQLLARRAASHGARDALYDQVFANMSRVSAGGESLAALRQARSEAPPRRSSG